jgi:hypothetical protein
VYILIFIPFSHLSTSTLCPALVVYLPLTTDGAPLSLRAPVIFSLGQVFLLILWLLSRPLRRDLRDLKWSFGGVLVLHGILLPGGRGRGLTSNGPLQVFVSVDKKARHADTWVPRGRLTVLHADRFEGVGGLHILSRNREHCC